MHCEEISTCNRGEYYTAASYARNETVLYNMKLSTFASIGEIIIFPSHRAHKHAHVRCNPGVSYNRHRSTHLSRDFIYIYEIKRHALCNDTGMEFYCTEHTIKFDHFGNDFRGVQTRERTMTTTRICQ